MHFEPEVIRSQEDSRFKELTEARGSKIFLEGTRLCQDAINSKVVPETIIFTEDNEELAQKWCGLFASSKAYKITDKLFRKISKTKTPQGIAIITDSTPQDQIPDGKFYLILDRIQDPGNMGTIIRSADAFGTAAVILLPGCCDPYTDKVLRASMGSIFHINVVKATNTEELFKQFKQKQITTYAMHLKGDNLNDAELTTPAAFFIGNEANGLDDSISEQCDKLIKIPMQGKAESLNAAVAASIISYIASNS